MVSRQRPERRKCQQQKSDFCQFFLSEWPVYGRAIATSVTLLGDLLDFGQLFKAFGNN